LKYTKYSCGFPPCSDENFLRNPLLPNHAVLPKRLNTKLAAQLPCAAFFWDKKIPPGKAERWGEG
jgi:hypothetical protein